MASRSGGAFAAISEIFLDGGVVYGCTLDIDFTVHHDRATTLKERDAFRKSKYVQSDMMDTFKFVKIDLNNGKKVLFSGTACQIAGLKSYLRGNNTDNLYCIDIICHGVPSPLIWSDYVNYIQRTSKVEHYEFRNKVRFGWAESKESITYDDGRIEYSDLFWGFFYGHNAMRPSCTHCKYANLNRPGDFTIGDAWGVTKANPEFNDDKGVSLLLINTIKGQEFLKYLTNKGSIIEVDIRKYMQPPLLKPFPIPYDRSLFWKQYKKFGFEKFLKHNVPIGIESKFRIKGRKAVCLIKYKLGIKERTPKAGHSEYNFYQYQDGSPLPDSSQPISKDHSRYTPHKGARYIGLTEANSKKIPRLYESRQQCCGCNACYAICPMSGIDRPVHARKTNKDGKAETITVFSSSNDKLGRVYNHTGAISMLPDEEGFLYPVVDASICIGCKKCESICIIKNEDK